MAGMYPVALKLEGQRCVVIGGGAVAWRKVESLLEAAARVRLISPDVTPELKDMATEGRIEVIPRRYRRGDLKGAFLVISAADDTAVNRAVAAECAEGGIMLNAVDDPPNCTFYVPACVRRGDLLISISTGGKSPMLARRIREQLEATYGPLFGPYLELVGEIRHNIIRNVSDTAEKNALLEALASPEIMEALRTGDRQKMEELVNRVVHGLGFESPHGPA